MPPSEPIPACAPNASAMIDEAIARAWEFAPVVHFHTLEETPLQDPSYWFNNSQMILTDTQPAGSNSSAFDFIFDDMDTFLLYGPKSYVTVLNNTKLTQDQINTIYNGAPFDANNHSTARVAFTVQEYDGNYFMFNYNLFYPWNGCSNQAIALNIGGNKNVTNYIMCPAGVHEADWERVSVLVCKSDWQVKRMAFSQHTWAEERDCTVEGQCLKDPETGHYMTFAGLDSHANYPEPSDFKVYEYINGNVSSAVKLDNLGGLYIGDRNNPDPYRKWVPSPELMLYVPPPTTFNDTLNSTNLWMMYPGNWGAPLQLPAVSLDCLNDAQTERYPCAKDNESTQLILRILKLAAGLPIGLELGGTGDVYTGANSSNSSLVGYPGIAGPLTRGYSETWVARPLPKIQNKNLTTLVCPKDAPEGAPLPAVDPSVFDVSVQTLVNYLIGVAIGDIVFSFLLVLVMALPALLDKSAKVQKIVVRKAKYFEREAAAAAVMATTAAKKATNAVESFLPGTSASEINQLTQEGNINAVLTGDEEAGNARPPVVAVAVASPSSSPTPSPASSTALDRIDSIKSSEILDLQVELDEGQATPTLIWFILGLGLFIAGITLSIYGVVAILNDSVLSAAINKLNAGSVGHTLEILLITGLSLIGGFDIIVIFMLFFMRPPRFHIGKFSMRNYLGGSKWCNAHVFELYVVALGLVVLALCIAAFFFALGFMLTIVQVFVRLLCKGVMGVTVFGQTPLDVCISLPIIGVDRVCGWEAMEVCADITGMNVRYVMFGAMLLIWSHIVWLIVLTLALERRRRHMLVIKRSESTTNLPEE